jgi:hypothetical protein
MYISGMVEFIHLNEPEFKDIIERWQSCNNEINELYKDSQYQSEFTTYKSSLSVSVNELRKFSDKLWEFQKSIVHYHRVCGLMTKLNYQCQKFFLKEFHQRVEILFNNEVPPSKE